MVCGNKVKSLCFIVTATRIDIIFRTKWKISLKFQYGRAIPRLIAIQKHTSSRELNILIEQLHAFVLKHDLKFHLFCSWRNTILIRIFHLGFFDSQIATAFIPTRMRLRVGSWSSLKIGCVAHMHPGHHLTTSIQIGQEGNNITRISIIGS
jgi:hypothetical protein